MRVHEFSSCCFSTLSLSRTSSGKLYCLSLRYQFSSWLVTKLCLKFTNFCLWSLLIWSLGIRSSYFELRIRLLFLFNKYVDQVRELSFTSLLPITHCSEMLLHVNATFKDNRAGTNSHLQCLPLDATETR